MSIVKILCILTIKFIKQIKQYIEKVWFQEIYIYLIEFFFFYLYYLIRNITLIKMSSCGINLNEKFRLTFNNVSFKRS